MKAKLKELRQKLELLNIALKSTPAANIDGQIEIEAKISRIKAHVSAIKRTQRKLSGD